MAPRKRRSKSTSRRKSTKPVDPLFGPIKAKIEAARNKLRQEAKHDAQKTRVHQRYLRLKAAHRLLGFGPLDNIIF